MPQITVHAASGPYAVIYRRGVLARAGSLVSALGEWPGVYLLSSPRVWKLWGKSVEGALRLAGKFAVILFNDQESAKTVRTVETLCRRLVRAGADRRSLLVAVGGGVVGDVAGFVAASYMRGVAVVHVPTTLVAQVDSAIGGKTGVNLPEGKNLVGAFYPPRLVLADPDSLRTLPPRQFRAGLYEVIKYGVVRDADLFGDLEKNMARLVARDAPALDNVIPRCMTIKAEVVSRDERESGFREILNFGHTVGHALEAATRFSRFLHGEAVAWGMIAAARLAENRRILDLSSAERIERLVRSVGWLPAWPNISAQHLLKFMHADKKTRGSALRFVLPRRIGRVEIGCRVPEDEVRSILKNLGR